jgi:hypothetical protein
LPTSPQRSKSEKKVKKCNAEMSTETTHEGGQPNDKRTNDMQAVSHAGMQAD